MYVYALLFNGKFLGVYRTRAKAQFAAMKYCKQNANILKSFDAYKKQDRAFARKAKEKGEPFKEMTFLDYIFLPTLCKIELTEAD